MNQKKATAATNIQNRHVEAAVAMTETVKKISDNCKTDDESFNAVHRQNEDFFEEMGVE